MYGNALGLGALFFSRLYTGNIRFTNKLLPKKQHKTQSEKLNTCEDTFQTYLSMYPLVFR
jgi:hypothetical protein